MKTRDIKLTDGAHCRVTEAGAGAPVLLIHGVGLQARAWAPQIKALAQSHRVVAVDLPGHGGSDLLVGTPGLKDYVDWTARGIEALGLGPVSVAGHSMGALITAGLAIERPDLVCRAALLNGAFRRSAAARAAVLERAAGIAEGQGATGATLDRWFTDDQQAARRAAAALLAEVSPEGYAATYRAFAEGDRVYADRLSEIMCPFLAMTGSDDPNSTPAMSREMARLVPNGRAVVIDGHRHMVNLTAPDQVAAAFLNWLETEPQAFQPEDQT